MKSKVYIGALIVFLIDVVSKFLVVNYLVPRKSYDIIPNFFYLYYVKNDGAAFSLFSGCIVILIILAIIMLIYINKKMIKNNMSKLESFSLSLLIGGISGNLFDRVFRLYVVDFIGFKIFGYSFPIFNIADIAICIGTFLFIISIIRGGKDENKSK